MKHYLSAGIGDFVCIDSLLSLEEKSNITELYLGCRFGKSIESLIKNNRDYKNIKYFYTISEDIGRFEMGRIEPGAVNFWHFRPDFPERLNIVNRIFQQNFREHRIIDVAAIFNDNNRKFIESSLLKEENLIPYSNFNPKSYILVHFPTSSRPRSDIASLNIADWKCIESCATKNNKNIVVISDVNINVPINNIILLVNPPINSIPWITKNSYYYFGCDSFIAGLASKCLTPDRISIKSHNPNVRNYIHSQWGSRYFLPYPPQIVETFYKPFLEDKT